MNRNKILFSGELPPKSLHGVANSNEIVVRFLSEKFDVLIDEEYVDLKFHGSLSYIKFRNYIKRLITVISLSKKNKFKYFYIVFSVSLPGAIKTILIILLFRMFNLSTECVVHVHRGDLKDFVQKYFINKYLFGTVLNLTHKLILLSETAKDFIEKNFRNRIEIYVLPNTVNIEFTFDDKCIFKKHESETLNFLFISNYIQEKGILLLLETFNKLDDRFRLDCYGNFSSLELKEKILSFKSKRIIINGPIFGRDKFLKIRESDALILPSYNEGKPIVLLEALSVGTPFIAPDIGYIKEMVFQNYPFIYSNNTSEDLSEMILKFSRVSSAKKSFFRKSVIRYYTEKFSNAKYKEKLFKIFSE